MQFNELAPNNRKSKKRVGRGIGSGSGKTCGRGHKGLKSRSGGRVPAGFEGGQMPLKQRLPKFGFTSKKSRLTTDVRVGDLNKLNVETIDIKILKEQGLVRKINKYVKIVSTGEISKKLTIKNIKIMPSAKAKIEAAGGKVII